MNNYKYIESYLSFYNCLKIDNTMLILFFFRNQFPNSKFGFDGHLLKKDFSCVFLQDKPRWKYSNFLKFSSSRCGSGFNIIKSHFFLLKNIYIILHKQFYLLLLSIQQSIKNIFFLSYLNFKNHIIFYVHVISYVSF